MYKRHTTHESTINTGTQSAILFIYTYILYLYIYNPGQILLSDVAKSVDMHLDAHAQLQTNCHVDDDDHRP